MNSLNNNPLDIGLNRRFIPNGRNLDMEVGVTKLLQHKNSRVKIRPFIGIVSSSRNLSEDFAQISKKNGDRLDHIDSGKAGLRATWETAGFDISGTLTYFDSRVR